MSIESEIKGVYDSHPIVLLGKWAVIMLVFAVVACAGWFVLADDFMIRILFVSTMILATTAMLVTSHIHWRVNTDIVTERKLVSVRFHGLFHFALEEIELENIHSLDLHQEGILQNLLSYGDILISSEIFGKGTQHDIVLKNIRRVEEMASLLKSQCASCKYDAKH